jgi:hypothetical protein
MLTDLTLPSKDTTWQTGLKRKIQQSVETYLIDRNKNWLRVKGWKKIYQANGPPKTGRSGNTYFRQTRLQTYIDQIR